MFLKLISLTRYDVSSVAVVAYANVLKSRFECVIRSAERSLLALLLSLSFTHSSHGVC